MKISFYKYQGTGNDFILVDNRQNTFPVETTFIKSLCDRRFGIGADGLILLQASDTADFAMQYFNADGNQSSMCGNGGRCLVRFAHDLKLIDKQTHFIAMDGVHHAWVYPDTISLEMMAVTNITLAEDHVFLDTGSPHHVSFVQAVAAYPVFEEGKRIRYSRLYMPQGTNVNFVEVINDNTLFVRTYERGVEDETLSCGTGVTASVIAAFKKGLVNSMTVQVRTLGGNLELRFDHQLDKFENIKLTGPASLVFKGEITTP